MPGSKEARALWRVFLVLSTLLIVLAVYSAVWASPSQQNGGDASGNVVLIALNEQNDSGGSGWAKLTARGDDTEVVLSLTQGVMVSSPVHIHLGPCGNETLGPVVYPLTFFSNGSSVSLLEDVSLDSLLNGDFAINAHYTDDPRVYTACGNIPAQGDFITIALEEQNDSGASGWATLIARDDDTEVVLFLTQGVMVSSPVHIHLGPCGNETLGPVIHPLTSFSNGDSVSLVEDVTLDSLLTGDFSVNAHYINDATIYTACGNIPTHIIAIAAGTASTLTSGDGVVTVSVPAAAPVEAGTLSYEPKVEAQAPAAAPAGLAFGSTLFDLSVLDLNNDPIQDYRFGTPITISVMYTDDDVQAAEGNPGRLVLYKYDMVLQAWIPLNTTFDPVTKSVQAQVSRLSFFALMGQAQPPTPTPTPTATLLPGVATPTPTVTPTPEPAPTATLLPPTPGDVAPGSGLLTGLLIAAFILMAAGGYYLRSSRQS